MVLKTKSKAPAPIENIYIMTAEERRRLESPTFHQLFITLKALTEDEIEVTRQPKNVYIYTSFLEAKHQ